MGRPRGAWRRSAGPAVVVAVGLLWARPTDRAGSDAAWRAAWPRPARAPGSPGDAARVVGRARPPRRAPGQRRTLRRARGGEELRPLHRSEFGVLDCGGKWTEPTCPECGSVMLLRKRIQPGRGAGGCFYSCDACNTSVKPVNRKDADRRAKQKSVAIMLRDYQKVDVERVRKAFQDDNWDMVVLSMATGAGKTSVANAYIAQHEGESLVWWTAPSCELLEQAEMNMRRLSPRRNRFRLGLWSVMPDVVELPRSYHQVSPRARTGATVYMTEQLLFRRLAEPRPEVGSSAREGGLEAILPQLLVVDESHWAGLAKTGIVLLKWARFHGVRVLGLSATPRPHPAPLQPIIHSASLVQLASRGVLAWPRLWAVRRRLRESPLRPELVFDMRDHQEGAPR
ncbi:unnamed protein product [Prorocentrum cordatum]|uniref:Helicase ATP-binding domain-containing protein n=1 Tax=Prorocentrum cordatum TaxID=2364126 RepID=A0ABN9TUQ7_9DINO|nr:unnamed protein product [Polarella glacialis]